jgi:hypothetical protein
MLRDKFIEIISEGLYEGYSRGITVFMESLEEDLAKKEVINESSLDGVIDYLMEDAGYVVEDDEE